ncbi:MAG: hypothetical protein LBH00_05980 [Planctomycetaceae bacterium]|jgi:hypothetical protein|nr:hypothetical protein [Planctomycetaceae bacterium]
MAENLGFLTVIDQHPAGLIGGYLVLNPAARPLEFLCTTPVQPDKIQEILYGETLLPFLCGEKIAKTLVQRAKTAVSCVFTNHAAVLPIQSAVPPPVVYVFDPPPEKEKVKTEEKKQDTSLLSFGALPFGTETGVPTEENRAAAGETGESLKSSGIDNFRHAPPYFRSGGQPEWPEFAGFDASQWKEVRIGKRTAAVPCLSGESFQQIVEEVMQLAKMVDIREPFDRIRLAIEEAGKAA